MDMFKNYENNSYTAYNLTEPKISTMTQRYICSPVIGYDKYKNIKCFVWDPNDEFNLNLSLGFKISVFEDSIIYEGIGQHPNSFVAGYIGQRAYNIAEGKSWLCKGTLSDTTSADEWIPIEDTQEENLPEWIPLSTKLKRVKNIMTNEVVTINNSLENTYVWEQDNLLTFPKDGTKEIIISPNMENKILQATFMNFRHEIIYSYEFGNVNTCSIPINLTSTPLLVEGQFFINIYIKDVTGVQQQNQYNVMIIENPNKYINSLNNEKYIFTSTIQEDKDNIFIWEPILTSSSNDYVWIPITSELFALKGDN